MSTRLRLATFNLENLDDKAGQSPTLDERIAIMRPQLERVDADLICLQEVNAQSTPAGVRDLSALKKLIKGTQYEQYCCKCTVTAGNIYYDERNLVVLSKFPASNPVQIKHDLVDKPQYRKVTAKPAESAKDISWERPIFYLTIDVTTTHKLHLLVVHLKSKIPTDIAGQKKDNYTWHSASGWAEGYFVSSMKRVGQALEARIKIDEIFDAEAGNDSPLVAVCGDFNSDFDEVCVTAIRGPVEETGNPVLATRVMAPCELTVPESSRYSLLYLGKGLMLDHILVSRGLLAHYRGAEIHNEILPDESGAFRTDQKFPESDHAPVIAEFELP
jgi:endonuclease/exonuclease/phosphatase family metal-dependent hydrolase